MSLTNLIRWILLLFYLALALPLSLFAAWFLFRAQTWTGVGLSVLTLLGILLPVPLVFWLSQPTQRPGWGQSSLLLIRIEAGLLGLVLWQTPNGVSELGLPVQHRFVQPVSFPRYTIANIVPKIGVALATPDRTRCSRMSLVLSLSIPAYPAPVLDFSSQAT